MADEPYVLDGQVYQDETAAMVANHPHIPDDIKRIYITGAEDSKGPLGTSAEAPSALKTQEGTQVAPAVTPSPEPSYDTPLNPADDLFGFKKRAKLFPSEDDYFKANPNVAGMAAETNDIILNPYSSKNINQDSVVKNEAFRLYMRNNGITPDFKITDAQKEQFKGTSYYDDEDALKQTIAARIYSGDPSANATDEQKEHTKQLIQNAKSKSQPDVRPEPYGLNPPEQGPGFAEPKGEPKVMYKTPNGVEITDQDIDKAISVSMGVGAGTMTGITSKTFGRGALAEAQAMEALGHHPEDIWSATGNYKGVDGRWRQEIPDNQAKIKAGAYDTINSGTYPNNKDIRLAHILEHQDLYNAYPWAQNIKMKIDPGAGTGASYDELMNTIHLGPKAINEETVLHEVQHAIQSREGFAKGGAEAKQFALRYEQDVANMRKEAQTFIDRDKAGDKFTKEDKDRIQVINRVLELDSERRKIASTVAHQNYLKLAGEVESRNTETRMLLDAIGRRKFFPEWTQDVKNRDQIVSQKPLWTTPYGATDNPMRAPNKAATGVAGAAAIQYNMLGDLYDKLTGSVPSKQEEKPKITKLDSYPTQDDARKALEAGFGYGTGLEDYMQAKHANVIGSVNAKGQWEAASGIGYKASELADFVNQSTFSKNLDLDKPENWKYKQKLGTTFTQAGLAAAHSAIATVGFDPHRIGMDLVVKNATLGGSYKESVDGIYANIGELDPSSVLHESIHRGLKILRDKSPEVKELMNNLPREEYVVRYLMTQLGDPEKGLGNISDSQRDIGLKAFEGSSGDAFRERLAKIELIAAEVHKDQRPRGPR